MADSEEDKTARNVFISYGRETDVTSFVKQLKKDLEANGYTVWLDLESIPSGSDWHGAIGTGLHDCASIIPIITQKYIGSRYCMNELYSADGDKKWIFPIMYQDVDLANSEEGRALKFIVSGINWSMFRPGQDDYSKSLQRLVEGMRQKAKEEARKAEIKAEEEKAFVITVGPTSDEPLNVISGIESPSQIATGRNGEIVVVSYKDHKVLVYDRNCTLLRTFGSSGFLDGQFMCPSGVAVDSHNRVLVSSLSKVDVFTMDGQFVTAAGSQGNGPLQFTNATGIAVGKNGKVYIADAQNNRIQILNSDLSFSMLFSEACKTVGPGRLNQPQAVAINSEGNLFVADMMNHTIQVFSPDDGKFLYRFGKYGLTTTPGALVSPMAIAIDAEDNVYVSNSTGSIVIFSKEGEFRRQFGSYGSEQGQFGMIKGLHIDSKGCLFVSEWMANRVQIFPTSLSVARPSGEEDENIDSVPVTQEAVEIKASPPAPVCKVGPTSSVPIKVIPDIQYANGITEGKNGEVIVISTGENKVMLYSPANDYKLTREFGDKGDGDDQFYNPSGVALTPEGLILVSSSNKLQWFTMEGDIVHVVGYREHNLDFDNPEAIAIGKDGLIYVLDTGKKCVKVLRNDGTFHSSFTFPHLDTDDKEAPTAMAINSEEKLFFTDSAENCVRVFSTIGEVLFKFGKSGNWMERGALMSPFAIAIDHNDNVFVGSLIMVSIFDKSGTFLRSFGGYDQFSFIKGIHIGNSGHIYISDQSNNNVKIFEGPKPGDSNKPPDNQKVVKLPFPRPLYTVGPTSDEPLNVISGIESPSQIATGRNGEIVVVSYKDHKVLVYDRNCTLLRTFGSSGFLDGQFMCPSGVAVDSHNRVLVSSLSKVDVFTMDGQFVTAAGSQGNGPLQFTNATGIAVGKNGKVYIADAQNNRIQILNSDLSFSMLFSEACKTVGPGRLNQPQAVAINSEGNLFVADMMNHTIQVFSPDDGKFLYRFGKYGLTTTPGALVSPMAIAIDAEDNVYVSNSTGSIVIFSKEGEFRRQFGSYGSEQGQFGMIKGLHIDSKGCLFVSEWMANRVQIFPTSLSVARPSGEEDENIDSVPVTQEAVEIKASPPAPVCKVGPTSSVPIKVIPDIQYANGITEGKNGEVIVISTGENKVMLYSPANDYKLTREFGDKGDGDDQFYNPSGVALTPEGLILVSSSNKLQWFTMEGDIVHVVGYREHNLDFDNPEAIAIGKDGLIYVLDTGKKCVKVLRNDGTFHSSFTFPHLDTDDKEAPTAMAINSEEKLFFTDSAENCVRVFSTIGEVLFKFGKSGNWMERGALMSPFAIAIDHNDNVFVGSLIMVSIFDKSGTFLRSFGGYDQFSFIKGIHIGNSGHIYISDQSNNNVKIFEGPKPGDSNKPPDNQKVVKLPFPRPLYTVGPSSKQPVKVIPAVMEPHGAATAVNGDLFVVAKKSKKIPIFSGDSFEQAGEIGRLYSDKARYTEMADLEDIVPSDNGSFLIAMNHQVLEVMPNGDVTAAFGTPGRRGNTETQLYSPTGIAVGRRGLVFVVDSGNNCVKILNADLSYKTSAAFPDNTVDRPSLQKIALSSKGSIYVTDSRNNLIHVFNQAGKFLFSFEAISSPGAIAVDHEDFLYIADSDNIRIFDGEGHFVRAFGVRGDKPGEFGVIKALHISDAGNLFVSECKNNRIQVFTGLKSRAQAEKDRASKEEAVLDTLMPDVCLCDIHDPFGIAAGKNGEIVVANTSEHNVSVYNNQQQLVVQFGVRGTLDGQMVAPTGVTVTADNYILVSCRDKLQWFTMKGELVYAVGNKGKEVLEFEHPLSIALGKDENIYVLEKGSKRVQVLKGDASFHSSFDFDKKHTPEAIAIDSQGRIFLVDTRKSCVQIYSQEGTHISMFNTTGSSAPTFPTAIAIDHKDNVYIGTANGEVFVFDNCGCFLQGFRASGSPGCYSVIRGLHVSLSGHVYISDFSTNEVRAFKQLNILSSAEGMSASTPSLPVLPYSPIYKVGPKSAQPVRVLSGVRDPNGVVTDNRGNVIVTSKQDNKILIYSSDDSDKPLNAISELKNPREPRNKRMINPAGLEYTHDGYLLVCFSAQMVKMDYSGTAVAFLGNPRNRSGTRDDEMSGPGGIALGSKGEIFLVDRGNHRIQIFDSNFTFVKSLFNPDSRERSHEYLERVAVNSAGDLYVTDYRNHNIQVYNKDGRFMFTFGKELKDIKERFYKRGGLSSPYAIAIDKDDFVYVGDKNGVVSIFDKDGGFVRSFGGSGDQPGQFGNIQAMHFDAEGQLYVCEWKTNRVQVFK